MKPSLDYCPARGDHRPSKLTGHRSGVLVRGLLPWRVYLVCPACGFKERA